MTRKKLNKIKIVKKLSRQIKIPAGKVIPSEKRKEKRSKWKREIKNIMEKPEENMNQNNQKENNYKGGNLD